MFRSLRRSSPAESIDVLMFLQSSAPKRWVARRKAAVVLAVRAGFISLADACDQYRLSVDEFTNWEAAFDDGGIAGLLAKRPALKLKGPSVHATNVRHTFEPRKVRPEPQSPLYR
jgi:hypothetical protein